MIVTRTTKPPKAAATKVRAAPATPVPLYGTPEWVAYRKAAIAKTSGFMDYGDPTGAAGHEYGIRVSSRLTRDYRRTYKKLAMDIGPNQVVDVLAKAGLKKWVLIGLHSYVGYLPDPRATQDVDILVSQREKTKAAMAIREAWPTLIVNEFPEVVRFSDPNDLDFEGNLKPTIDLMLPCLAIFRTILKHHVLIDEKTQHAILNIEAALVSKYSALMSETRPRDKREMDGADFRRIAKANRKLIDLASLRLLAEEVSGGAGDEVVKFLDLAFNEQPFPF